MRHQITKTPIISITITCLTLLIIIMISYNRNIDTISIGAYRLPDKRLNIIIYHR